MRITPAPVDPTAEIDAAVADLVPDSAFTAKGDLLVGTGAGAYAAVTIGADGTIPIADSSEATGVRWETTVGAASSTYYLTQAASDLGGGRLLASDTPGAGAETTIAQANTGTSDTLIGTWDTPALGVTQLPEGTAYRHIHAKVNGGAGRLKVELYTRTSGGTETLRRTGYSQSISNTSVGDIVWSFNDANGYAMDPTDRIVFKVYTARVSGPTTVTMTVYLDGVTHASYIVTTISDVAVLESSLADSIAAKIPKSLVDADGDLIVGTAADTAGRLAIGTDTYVLVVDTSLTGSGKMKWADAYGLPQQINAQTGTTYTPVLSDAGKLVTLSNGSAITLTVPPNADVAFAVGTRIDLAQIGAGQVTVAQGSGVTVSSTPTLKARAQYSGLTLVKTATNTWLLFGDLAAS
jgi:hypothetical protein